MLSCQHDSNKPVFMKEAMQIIKNYPSHNLYEVDVTVNALLFKGEEATAQVATIPVVCAANDEAVALVRAVAIAERRSALPEGFTFEAVGKPRELDKEDTPFAEDVHNMVAKHKEFQFGDNRNFHSGYIDTFDYLCDFGQADGLEGHNEACIKAVTVISINAQTIHVEYTQICDTHGTTCEAPVSEETHSKVNHWAMERLGTVKRLFADRGIAFELAEETVRFVDDV